MGGPTSSGNQDDLTCPNCLKPGMVVLESELPYRVLYCPQCDFAIKEPHWRSQRKNRHGES